MNGMGSVPHLPASQFEKEKKIPKNPNQHQCMLQPSRFVMNQKSSEKKTEALHKESISHGALITPHRHLP